MRLMVLTGGLVAATILAVGACSEGGAQGEPGDEVTKEQYDTWMTELSNWGRWGDDDQVGALNLITSAKRIDAARLVETGTVVSMARTMTIERLENPDQASANRLPVLVGSVRSVFDMDTEGGYFWERYEIEYHGARSAIWMPCVTWPTTARSTTAATSRTLPRLRTAVPRWGSSICRTDSSRAAS